MAIKLEIKNLLKYLVSIHSELSNISNKDFQRTNSGKNWAIAWRKRRQSGHEEGEIFVIMGLSGSGKSTMDAFSIA